MLSDKCKRIFLAQPDLKGKEKEYVLDAIESSWISSSGAYLSRFEKEFAQLCGAGQALGVSNGTVALHLAMLGLGIGPGDEVIIPSFTYVATANAVRYVGADPVFVDVDEASWGICPRSMEAAITPRTKAVIPVHLYGHPADMDPICESAKRANIAVVEDAAEAHLALYKGRPVGGIGDIATFSFYGNKILTSGEGGAITVNDQALADRMRLFRGQGMDPNRRYYHPVVGYNYRMTNIAAALLCAQIERASTIIAARKKVIAAYEERLKGVQGLGFRPHANWAEPAPWMMCLTVDPEAFGMNRDELMSLLDQESVETRPFFIPAHTLPPFVDARRIGALPLTERLSQTGLNLPTHGEISMGDIERICTIICDARRGARRVTPQ